MLWVSVGEWVHGGMCSVRLAVMYVTMTLRSNKVMSIVRWMMQVMGMTMMTAMSSIMRISRVESVWSSWLWQLLV